MNKEIRDVLNSSYHRSLYTKSLLTEVNYKTLQLTGFYSYKLKFTVKDLFDTTPEGVMTLPFAIMLYVLLEFLNDPV